MIWRRLHIEQKPARAGPRGVDPPTSLATNGCTLSSSQAERRPPTGRTLPARTECYSRRERQYQSYLDRVRPVARAEFYRRLMERQGLKSTRVVARVTGEDRSRVARVLKILELPEPVLQYLRSHDSPAIVGYFTEKKLRELVALGEHRRIWQEFQRTLRELGEEPASI